MLTIFDVDKKATIDKEYEVVENLLKNISAEKVSKDIWGKKKFAYKIGTKEEGFYVLFKFAIDATKLDELKNELKLNSSVVRYMITKNE